MIVRTPAIRHHHVAVRDSQRQGIDGEVVVGSPGRARVAVVYRVQADMDVAARHGVDERSDLVSLAREQVVVGGVACCKP
jgi:hypothetical protein